MIEIMNLRNTKPSKPWDFYVDRRSPVGNLFKMLDKSKIVQGIFRTND